jgi:hypothetical protein
MYALILIAVLTGGQQHPVAPFSVGTFQTMEACLDAAKSAKMQAAEAPPATGSPATFLCVKQK